MKTDCIKLCIKYMRLAKIPISPQKKKGMHSLRHTLASRLLEENTPLSVISDILGHVSTDSTAVYLKVDVERLRECALNPEEVFQVMTEFVYSSPFQEFIQEMIRQKRSLGYKYDSSERVLYKFDQFCLAYGCTEPILFKELVNAWIQKRPNEAQRTLRTGQLSYGNWVCT